MRSTLSEPMAMAGDKTLGDEGTTGGTWPMPPSVPSRQSAAQRTTFVPLVMALIVGVAAGFGWGYWTAFRTIERPRPSPAVPSAAAGQRPRRCAVEEPEVIGERNLPSPRAAPRETRPPAAAPRPAPTRPVAPAAPPAETRGVTKLPPGRLVVRSTPPGAQVRVDGRVRGRRRWCWREMPLRVVRVTIEREGFKPDERRVALSAAQPTVTVDARLAASAPPPAGVDNRRAGDRSRGPPAPPCLSTAGDWDHADVAARHVTGHTTASGWRWRGSPLGDDGRRPGGRAHARGRIARARRTGMNAVLALEDGTWFGGTSVGAAGETSGKWSSTRA
jgi:hypothetical protein